MGKLNTEPMLTLIDKEEISDEELLECQQIDYNLITFELRHEPSTRRPLSRYIQSLKSMQMFIKIKTLSVVTSDFKCFYFLHFSNNKNCMSNKFKSS